MPRKRNSSRLLGSGKVAARIAEAPADGFPVVAGLKLPPALEYGRPACVSNGHRAPWAAMALFLECNGSDEETNAPTRADDRNFYKLEKWTKDGTKVDRLLYADNNLDKARDLFAKAIKHRPKIS